MRYVESLNQALHTLMADDGRIVIIGEDILDPYGGAFKVTKGLSTMYPERVLSTPVSEAGITGFAVGMALRGLRPILEIMFGDFLTLCADQIINSASKFEWMYNGQVKVPLVIRAPMGGRRGYGPTHSQTLETLFLNTPQLKIIAPSHYHAPGDLLTNATLKENGPVLFIENKSLYPKYLSQPGLNGKIGDFFVDVLFNHSDRYPTVSLKAVKEEPPAVTLIAYGGMAPLSVEAAFNVFIEHEIITEVIIPSLIKPMPIADVLPSIKTSRRVIITEEAVLTSGWGAELASQIYENAFDVLVKPIQRLGAKEMPIAGSGPLEEQILPQIADIERAIHKQIEE